jgi:hypothetical protein
VRPRMPDHVRLGLPRDHQLRPPERAAFREDDE